MSVYAESGKDRGRRHVRLLSGLAAAVGLGLARCHSSDALPVFTVYEVKGKVLLSDGKPLDGGWISFVPKGDLPVTPSSPIGSDGAFSLVTGGSGEGAPAGEYKVRIDTTQRPAIAKGRSKPPFPSKYTDEDSSGLVITVRAEPNRLEPIVLK